jgi:hypothetical protein
LQAPTIRVKVMSLEMAQGAAIDIVVQK